MMNIVNGGVHADNPIDFQEFMIMPVGAPTFRRSPARRRGNFPYAARRAQGGRLNTNVGDEGGFAPNLKSAEAALDFVMQAIAKAGYKPGGDVMLALDCAATEFFKDGTYVYEGEGKKRSRQEQAEYLADLVAKYPDRLHRGRHGGRRLGRLEAAHDADRRASASSSATICS